MFKALYVKTYVNFMETIPSSLNIEYIFNG